MTLPAFIQVFRLSGGGATTSDGAAATATSGSGCLYSVIDSHGSKMKRPTGLAVTDDRHLVVVDIASDCVRKYRYY